MTIDTTQNKRRQAEILLIEDNKGDVILAQKAFSKAHTPNRITVANNGIQAMEILNRHGEYANAPVPDIILMDLNLPKKNGKDVLHEIKTSDTFKRIPVIIFSSSRAELDVVKSYELHANSYIIKPGTLQQYGEVVTTIENFWFSLVILPDEQEAKNLHSGQS